MIKMFYISLATLFLCGCVTNYKGKGPDFSLKGAEAQKEIERFTFGDHYMDQRPKAFEMGPSGRRTVYWSDSLKPIIKNVSPEGYAELERAEWWADAWWVPYGIALGVLAAELINKDKDWHPASQAIFWSALGTSIGFSFYQLSVMESSAKKYNQDLKSKFAPGIGYNVDF